MLSLLTSPKMYRQFLVEEEVARIQETTQLMQWRHVRTRDSPADLTSRGVSVIQRIDSKLWWNGLTFLEESPLKW